jgi:chromosome segregation ATPase
VQELERSYEQQVAEREAVGHELEVAQGRVSELETQLTHQAEEWERLGRDREVCGEKRQRRVNASFPPELKGMRNGFASRQRAC